jgi:very-short-patch-repair endonuclease
MNKIHFARNLRKKSTEAERHLWKKLRSKQFMGLKFRRQQPVGEFIVDFICFERKIIIEVDGSQHLSSADYDRKRDHWLESQGFTIFRFFNNEILSNISGVMECLYKFIMDHPPLSRCTLI